MKNGNFSCKTCSRVFKLRHHLKAHLSRKIPCIPKMEYLFQKNAILEPNINPNDSSKCDLNKKNAKWNNYSKKQKKFKSQTNPEISLKSDKSAKKNGIKWNKKKELFEDFCQNLVLPSEQDLFQCNNCNKYYKYKYNLNKHFKKCCKKNVKNVKKIKKKQENTNEMLKMISQLNKKLDLLKNDNNKLTKTIGKLTINNYTSYDNSITNNVVVNNYGNEDMSFIKHGVPEYKNFITSVLQQGFPGLQKYIDYKYCNTKHEENFTIKYTNKRQKDIYIRQNNKWISKNKNEIMSEIYNWDKNVEEVLNIYERVFDIKDSENMDDLQANFVNTLESVYFDNNNKTNNTDNINNINDLNILEKAKQGTLNKLYDCYVNNKNKF